MNSDKIKELEILRDIILVALNHVVVARTLKEPITLRVFIPMIGKIGFQMAEVKETYEEGDTFLSVLTLGLSAVGLIIASFDPLNKSLGVVKLDSGDYYLLLSDMDTVVESELKQFVVKSL